MSRRFIHFPVVFSPHFYYQRLLLWQLSYNMTNVSLNHDKEKKTNKANPEENQFRFGGDKLLSKVGLHHDNI